jgi:hypothetical protein
VAAPADKMSSLGNFQGDLWINGKKFTHPVNLIDEQNDNIMNMDFIYTHKLMYDVYSRQVKFARINNDTLYAIKQAVLPAMASMVINAKCKGKVTDNATYIANICVPRTPMILGMPSIIMVDKNYNG